MLDGNTMGIIGVYHKDDLKEYLQGVWEFIAIWG